MNGEVRGLDNYVNRFSDLIFMLEVMAEWWIFHVVCAFSQYDLQTLVWQAYFHRKLE